MTDRRNLELDASSDKKEWSRPVMEKLDVSVHTQNLFYPGDDGLGPGSANFS